MLALDDMSPLDHERVVCSIRASVNYEVPTNIVLAIAEKEAGKPGLWVKNKNGSYDIGTMQFNTTYLKDLAPFGIRPEDVALKGCYAYDLAAWRIRNHLQHDSRDVWTRAANYHSKTPKYNRIYRQDLIKKALRWHLWLNEHFLTYSVTKPGLTKIFVTSQVRTEVTDAVVMHRKHKAAWANTAFNKPAVDALARFFRPSQFGGLQ